MASPLSCKLCSKSFTDPRLLPCLHIFCKSCLESLQSQNEGALTCPTCYKTSPHPPTNLPRHFRMEKDSTLSWMQQSREVVCGTCEKNNKAEAYCEDCRSAICSDCVHTHKELIPLRSHILVSLDGTDFKLSPTLNVSRVQCDKHPDEALKYYFKSGDLACSECIVEKKELEDVNDEYTKIDEAVSNEKEELLSALAELEKVAPLLAEPIENVEKVIKDIEVP